MSKKRINKPVVRVFLALCLSILLFGLVMTIVPKSEASSSNSSSDDQEVSLLDIYREKQYKGALDEENLVVLKDLQTSESLKKKSSEAEEGF